MESVEGKNIRASSPLPWLVSPVPTNGIEAQLVGIRVTSCLRCYKGQGGGGTGLPHGARRKLLLFYVTVIPNEQKRKGQLS